LESLRSQQWAQCRLHQFVIFKLNTKYGFIATNNIVPNI
jgi:hypothetical protein